jgi:hypothetical protein
MINFSPWLKPDEVDAIRAFVAKQARALKQEEASRTPASDSPASDSTYDSRRAPKATGE